MASCKFQKIPCPNQQYGCTKLLLQSQWEEHLERECRFTPVQCPWCSKKVHNKEVSKLIQAGPARGGSQLIDMHHKLIYYADYSCPCYSASEHEGREPCMQCSIHCQSTFCNLIISLVSGCNCLLSDLPLRHIIIIL